MLKQGSTAPRARRKEPSARYLDHCLAVADCYLTLVELARAAVLELATVQPEPASWRSYLGAGAVRETLKPDLFAVTASGEFEDHWFIELDRATESLPTVLRQCHQYDRYRRSGRAQADDGVFPRVVWVVPDEARAAKLRQALASDRALDAALFRVTTTAAFAAVIAGGAG